MMTACYPKKYYFSISLCAAAFAVFFIFVSSSYSQENFDKERALRVVSEKGGPGGCDSEASCATFCDNSDNLEVCINWARSNGVIVSEETVEKHSKIVREGGPGGCRTSEECHAFCEQPQNHDVCIDHAVQQGFMTAEEASQIREFRTREAEFRKRSEEFRNRSETKQPEPRGADAGFDKERALQIITAQGGPGGCGTFQECENFCDSPNNQSACFEFAEQNDLFTNKEELVKFKRIMQEGGPGGCRGERECHAFCESQANMEVCISFAEKNGLMPPEEIERAKKGIQAMREGGPAGCNTRESCENVCQNPANQEACFEWAKKHGLIPEDELRFIEESQKLRQEFESRRKEFEGSRPQFEGEHREDFRPPEGFKEFGPPREEFSGPGGCQGPEECERYCATHPDECRGFGPPPGEHQQQPSDFEPRFDESRPEQTDPATECSKHGGTWTGITCEFSRQEEFTPPDDGSFSEPQEFQEEPRFEEFQKPEPESEPTSLRDNKFLGAITRFIFK